jgi:hypothetical protein
MGNGRSRFGASSFVLKTKLYDVSTVNFEAVNIHAIARNACFIGITLFRSILWMIFNV